MKSFNLKIIFNLMRFFSKKRIKDLGVVVVHPILSSVT